MGCSRRNLVEPAVARRGRNGLCSLLKLQFLLKLGKLLHGNFLFLIENLCDPLNFFDLCESGRSAYLVVLVTAMICILTHVMHQHALNAVLQRHRARVTGPASTS